MPENPTPQQEAIIAEEAARQAALAAANNHPRDFEAEGLARIATDQANVARAIAMIGRC